MQFKFPFESIRTILDIALAEWSNLLKYSGTKGLSPSGGINGQKDNLGNG